MSDVSDTERLGIVSEFIKDSPPGQLNDVFHDCQILLGDERLMKEGSLGALRDYTNEQFLTCAVPDTNYHVILCDEGELEEGTYIEPRSQCKFQFNYLTQSASSFERLHLDSDGDADAYRNETQASVNDYVAQHYPSGVSSVFCNNEKITVCIVDNKYSPSNFWSGRWRSRWSYQLGSTEIKGSLKVHVHYYEDGNVQLHEQKDITIKISPPKSPTELATLFAKVLAKSEHEFQIAVNEAYANLSDSIFKSLRRALPLTKTKFNWDQVAGYRLGSNLTKSK